MMAKPLEILVVDNTLRNINDAIDQLGQNYHTKKAYMKAEAPDYVVPVTFARSFDEGKKILSDLIQDGKSVIMLSDLYMTTEDKELKTLMQKAFPLEIRCVGHDEGVSVKELAHEDPLGIILYLVNLSYGGRSGIVTSEGHHGTGLQCVLDFLRINDVGSEMYSSWGKATKDWDSAAQIETTNYFESFEHLKKEKVINALKILGINPDTFLRGNK